tara:strand:- start:464 stop:616 length:153 start_codon:yes stop_codon:yes gene_type:complete
MGKYGYTFKGKYWILGAIGVVGLIFTSGILQVIFGIYTFGCVLGLIFGDK